MGHTEIEPLTDSQKAALREAVLAHPYPAGLLEHLERGGWICGRTHAELHAHRMNGTRVA